MFSSSLGCPTSDYKFLTNVYSQLRINSLDYLQKRSRNFSTVLQWSTQEVNTRAKGYTYLIYLITNKNVNTSGTLSVNLVNLVERNIKHQCKFSSNFWGNHFFQVDCMINWKKKEQCFTNNLYLCSTWSPGRIHLSKHQITKFMNRNKLTFLP